MVFTLTRTPETGAETGAGVACSLCTRCTGHLLCACSYSALTTMFELTSIITTVSTCEDADVQSSEGTWPHGEVQMQAGSMIPGLRSGGDFWPLFLFSFFCKLRLHCEHFSESYSLPVATHYKNPSNLPDAFSGLHTSPRHWDSTVDSNHCPSTGYSLCKIFPL